MPRRKSNSSETLCRVFPVMEGMAVVIRCLNSGKDRGRGGTNTLSFMQPHKKSHGVKSGDLGGHLHHTTLHQTQRADQDSCRCKCILSARISCTRRKWILGWVVSCEIVCEMHVAQLLQTFFANCKTRQLFCSGVAILKTSGI
jgi:hypothetical protein